MKRHTALRDACIVMTLLDTGLRVSELARLNVGDVDLNAGSMVVRPFGTGNKTKGRVVYFGKTTKKTLWRYAIDRYEHEPLFLTVDEGRMDRNSIRCMLNYLGKNAGVPNCHPHRFRHTFAIEYLRAGGDVFTLQRLLGHSTLQMVQNYLALVPADVARAYRSPSDIATLKQ